MNKKLITILTIIIVFCLLAFWRLHSTNQGNHNGYTCVDNRKSMVSDLGGPQEAAGNGVSTTLKGCSE